MDRRAYLRRAGAAGALALAGCLGGPEDGTGTTSTTDGGGTTGTDGATETSADGAPSAETVVTGLEVPWGSAELDGTRYLTERPGRIVRVEEGSAETVADLTDSTAAVGEGGLMGLAFHPDGTRAYVYQTYRASGELRNRVLEFDPDDWRQTRVLVDGIPGARIHDGGRLLAYGNGLFVTAGDANNSRDAQDREALNGKVLRVTYDGDPHPENPWGTRVYSYGHRNPQGLAVHPESGDLYSTEHGPDTDDEVNVLRAGGNYGWPVVKGRSDREEFVDPIAAWTPTIAPAGATFYDGPHDGWRDSLCFGTLAGQHLHRLRVDPGSREVVARERLFEGEYGRLRTTWTAEGDLYVVTSNRDGRGRPREGDDRVLRVSPGQG